VSDKLAGWKLSLAPGALNAGQFGAVIIFDNRTVNCEVENPAASVSSHVAIQSRVGDPRIIVCSIGSGTTNIRNTSSKHWKRWLGVESRCIVPMSSFSEFNREDCGDIWFAIDGTRPLVCFAGMWTDWTSVRKVREGETTNDLYALETV
jgi:putative SOS response-associated peptidase YedK